MTIKRIGVLLALALAIGALGALAAGAMPRPAGDGAGGRAPVGYHLDERPITGGS